MISTAPTGNGTSAPLELIKSGSQEEPGVRFFGEALGGPAGDSSSSELAEQRESQGSSKE